MAYDFRANQIRLNRIISSGSVPILVYPSSSAADFAGNLKPSFSTAAVGSDVFLYVSGSSTAKTVFGGDTLTSGSFRSLAGITGSIRYINASNTSFIVGGSDIIVNYNSLGQWEISGSESSFFSSPSNNVVRTTGSFEATYLSASTGAQITGSLQVLGGITGSLSGTTAGNPFLVAGPNVTTKYNTLGQWEVSSSGGSSLWTELNASTIYTTSSVRLAQLSASLGAIITGSVVQGVGCTAINNSHAEGYQTDVSAGSYGHAEGYQTDVTADGAHAEGSNTTAAGQYSHAEGLNTNTDINGNGSHAEGRETLAYGIGSHAEGRSTQANGEYSHAEGYSAIAGSDYSHAEGLSTYAGGEYSHVEGFANATYANSSHAEGNGTQAHALYSHAEGSLTRTYGVSSHAEGWGSEAYGTGSLAVGLYTIASGAVDGNNPPNTTQAAFGKYNLPNNTSSLFVIGDGLDANNRHDVLRVNSGSVEVTGSLFVTQTMSASIVSASYIRANNIDITPITAQLIVGGDNVNRASGSISGLFESGSLMTPGSIGKFDIEVLAMDYNLETGASWKFTITALWPYSGNFTVLASTELAAEYGPTAGSYNPTNDWDVNFNNLGQIELTGSAPAFPMGGTSFYVQITKKMIGGYASIIA